MDNLEGKIFSSSWGYEQTNVDFYRVEKVKGDWIWLQQIDSVESSDGELSMTGRVVPANPPKLIDDPFRRKYRPSAEPGGEYVKISSYEFARPWDGHPKVVSHYA